MLMIDDDMCLSLRNAGCACEKHLKLFYDNLGYDISKKEIYDNLTKGKPNKVRNTWMKTMGDTFRDFCKKLRDYVDTIPIFALATAQAILHGTKRAPMLLSLPKF